MPQSNPTQAKPDTAALDAAFEALKNYDQGSSRATLMPIDEAVVASLDGKAARSELERQLVAGLRNGGSVVAREFICSKLALIGTEFCVPALAGLLNSPQLATAGRNALEAIPGSQATKALRDSLSKIDDLQKIGVMNSLALRRDADSVRVLSALLKHDDVQIVGAAAAALGDIATSSAAKSVRSFLSRAPAAIRWKVADATLTCAERLLAAGKKTEAQDLYALLASKAQPDHVQLAAARGRRLAGRGN